MEIHLITVKSSSFDGLFLWRLDFIRSGLNFNAATQILHTSKLGQMIRLLWISDANLISDPNILIKCDLYLID